MRRRLWDSLFAEPDMLDLTTYVCAAMVLEQRPALLSSDFATNLQMLQRYPPIDMVFLLERAASLQERDASRPAAGHALLDELLDAASSGKEAIGDSMKMLAAHVGQLFRSDAKANN